MTGSSGSTGSGATDRHVWARTSIGWHVGFTGLMVLAATVILNSEPAGPRQTWVLVLLGAWTGWYALVGARLVGAELTAPRRARIHLTAAAAFAVTIAVLDPSVDWVLYILVPQAFSTLPRMREAFGTVSIALLGWVAAVLAGGAPDGTDTSAHLAVTVITMTFSSLVGGWIRGIIEQSHARAELIAELEAARAEAAELHRQSGIVAERERLAREIHDTLAQGFTSIVMLCEAAEPAVDADPHDARRLIDLARSTARENLAESRSLVAAMTPPVLATADLPAALAWMAERFTASHGVPARFEVVGPAGRLLPSTEVVLLRSAQEALANVAKHAGAQQVHIALADGDAGIELSIDDDGCGFDPAEVSSGHGLAGMRSRVHDIDGALTLRSAPGAGTTVRVVLP